MGGDFQGGLMGSVFANVSIHAPAWGATPLPKKGSDGIYRFNPRPRMGGDA